MKKQFDNLGFVIIRNFISKNKAKKLSKEFKDFCDNNPNETQPDDQVKGAPAYHNHEAFVELLSTKTSKVSKILKERILPSYSYARVYQKGNILEKHVDRKSCEISLTVHLDGDQEWEFYIEDKIGEVHEIVLTSGDAILYSGREVLHWRNEYKGSFYSQTFLHYVKSSGICKHNYFENTLNDLSKYIHIYKNFIPNELCDEIIEEYRNDTEWAKSKVVSGFNPKVRDCSVVNISTSKSSKKKKKIDNDICNYMNKIIKEELQIYPQWRCSHNESPPKQIVLVIKADTLDATIYRECSVHQEHKSIDNIFVPRGLRLYAKFFSLPQNGKLPSRPPWAKRFFNYCCEGIR